MPRWEACGTQWHEVGGYSGRHDIWGALHHIELPWHQGQGAKNKQAEEVAEDAKMGGV